MEEAKPPAPTRRLLFFWLIALFFVLLIIEWSFRIFITYNQYFIQEQTDWNIWQAEYEKMKRVDYDLGCYFSADSVKTVKAVEYTVDFQFIDLGVDSLRFRDDGLNPDRPLKILIVGDSFPWGYGVNLENIFSEVMEAQDQRLDAINASISGHGPQQYTRMIKRFAKSGVNFDIVLYCFFPGNDISEELSFRIWSENVKHNPQLAAPEYMPLKMVSDTYVKYSLENTLLVSKRTSVAGFLKRICSDWITLSRANSPFAIAIDLIKRKIGLSNSYKRTQRLFYFPEHILIHLKNGKSTRVYSGYLNEVAGESLANSETDSKADFNLNYPLVLQSMMEAKSLCDSLHKKLYLVYVPDKAEVYAQELAETTPRIVQGEILRKLNFLHDTFSADADSLGLDLIDLLPPVKNAAVLGKEPYFRRDIHFNPLGHQIWAQTVLQRLHSDLWLNKTYSPE